MLVAAPERWDETCFAIPAVRALAASGLQVGVMCGAGQSDFWRTIDGIEIVIFDENPDLSAWDAALAWECGTSAKAIRKAGVRRRIAPTGDRKLTKWATDPVEILVHVLEHRVKHYLATVEALGVATREPEFFLPASSTVAERNGTAALLCPDSDFGTSHEWPLQRWLELSRWLTGEGGLNIAVAEVANGRELGTRLAEALGGGVEVVPIASLTEAIPWLARHELVLAADGSLPHLAAHLGATCVVLFGPNDPAWRRPLGKHHAIVSHHTECAPCLMAKCPLDRRCMLRIEVNAVKATVRECMHQKYLVRSAMARSSRHLASSVVSATKAR